MLGSAHFLTNLQRPAVEHHCLSRITQPVVEAAEPVTEKPTKAAKTKEKAIEAETIA